MAVGPRYVLDTSAVLALRSDEPGAARVEALLRAGRAGRTSILLSFMTRMEMLYRIAADEDPEAARDAVRLIDAAGVRWVSCDPNILDEAARLKAGGGLSVADAWIAATAVTHDAVLVHKDPEMLGVQHLQQEDLGV